MTAVLGTLPFLATLWLLMVLGAAVLEESGAKIAAALKGNPVQSSSRQMSIRHHLRPELRRVSVERQRQRAAD